MIDIEWLSLWVVLPILGLALILALLRLLRGPTLPDRVVALDLLVSLGIGIVVAQAIHQQQPALLDVAVILALLAFLGTVAFALYVEEGSRR